MKRTYSNEELLSKIYGGVQLIFVVVTAHWLFGDVFKAAVN